MIQKTKTIAVILLIAVAVVGTIGIGTTEHAFATAQQERSVGEFRFYSHVSE